MGVPVIILTALGGMLLANALSKRAAAARGLDPEAVQDWITWVLFGALLGSRLIYLIQDPLGYLGSPLSLLQAQGAWTVPGVFLGTVAAAAWLILTGLRARRAGTPQAEAAKPHPGEMADAAAGPLLAGAAVTLLGWADDASWIAAVLMLAAYFALGPLTRSQPAAPGTVALAALILGSAAVLATDFFRPLDLDHTGGLSNIQWVALLLAALAYGAARIINRHKEAGNGHGHAEPADPDR